MMTRSNLLTKIKFLAVAVAANFANLLVTAQEKAADFSVDAGQTQDQGAESFPSNPILLVVGALIAITILVFVIKGRRK